MTARLALLLCLLGTGSIDSALALQWQINELHYQRGSLAAPTFAGGARSDTRILTFQHASGREFGDLFLFADYLDDRHADDFNDDDIYSELYVNFSLEKLVNKNVGFGRLSDIGLLAGINYSRDARVRKYLPGIRLSWNIPGFTFFNTDFTLYLDDSAGVNGGGAPAEDNSYLFDLNWAYPFTVGEHRFSIEGHGEYIAERNNEFGQTVHDWILLQPQFRYDLGHATGNSPDRLFVGVEWQYWHNKLGDKQTEDNVLQALIVLRL
ncbi:hypothetical protein [Thiohalophilus sp.]|uniref:hypothetical protein n=1 Tax=Thiohalophilus sp. TaxID=3028392 RepID=UPI002ACD82AF|nr:hypothetical protein [Thiohalophilus sp.]MDZ7804224.1 hypothetical protein [Thiohalophilus sp.]